MRDSTVSLLLVFFILCTFKGRIWVKLFSVLGWIKNWSSCGKPHFYLSFINLLADYLFNGSWNRSLIVLLVHLDNGLYRCGPMFLRRGKEKKDLSQVVYSNCLFSSLFNFPSSWDMAVCFIANDKLSLHTSNTFVIFYFRWLWSCHMIVFLVYLIFY